MRKTSSFVLPSTETVNLQKRIVDELPVPRSIKFGRLGYRHYLFVVTLSAVVAVALLCFGQTTVDRVLSIVFPTALAVLLLLNVRVDLRARTLVTRGACVIGRITKQKIRGYKTMWSDVRYEFNIASGTNVAGKGTDYTFVYLEKTPVLVFYDPNNPQRNVAYCCTFWRIRADATTLLEP